MKGSTLPIGKIAIAAAIIALGSATVFLTRPPSTESVTLLKPDDAAVVARGKDLYARECASCHGANGQGVPGWETKSTTSKPLAPPHDGTGHTWQHPDHALIELTKYGTSEVACRTIVPGVMPEFSEVLPDGDVIAILSYIKAKWPPATRLRHDQVNLLYAEQNRSFMSSLGDSNKDGQSTE